MVDRRRFLKASAGLALTAAHLPGCRGEHQGPRWDPEAFAKRPTSPVAVLPASSYQAPLSETIRRGLGLFGLDLRGRRVVLKPNLVEFDPRGVVNTHPLLVGAAVEAFRELGAQRVTVAEGPGHRRDTEYLLEASGLREVLADTGASYVDLNIDAARGVATRSRFTSLGRLYLPETVLAADLLVSMPKLKTHHWAAVTLSMKNLFGIMPGTVYGWPKNPLHWAGIDNSIVEINATLQVPRFNIVDGIVGMEGDGPIQGEPKASGIVVMGPDAVAVDATCARLMSILPERIGYLREADAFLGNAGEDRIELVGEPLEAYRQDYQVVEHLAGVKEAAPFSDS
jgi:uncharacterized protein (DUF362 family)